MTEEIRLPGQVPDAKTGFEIIWQSGNERATSYSLVKIPSSVPFQLLYKKPELNIDFKLIPRDFTHWNVAGVVDPDIMEILNLRVSEPRRGPTPPVVSELDLRDTQKFGRASFDPESQSLFHVNLNLPINNIYHFLYKVWRPIEHTKKFAEFVPNYILGGDLGYRILPQKVASIPGRNVSLTVAKI